MKTLNTSLPEYPFEVYWEPEVYLVAQTHFNDTDIGYLPLPEAYIDDYFEFDWMVSKAEALTQLAGQLCYRSWDSPKWTSFADNEKYIKKNVLESGHISLLYHSSVTLLLCGIDRTMSHEILRHHVGTAFSQVSQRYVDKPAFVMRQSIQNDAAKRDDFYDTIYASLERYRRWLGPSPHTKAQKEEARMLLPNCTETSLLMTANMQAWRNFLQKRLDPHADAEIRYLANRILGVLRKVAPAIFQDFVEGEK